MNDRPNRFLGALSRLHIEPNSKACVYVHNKGVTQRHTEGKGQRVDDYTVIPNIFEESLHSRAAKVTSLFKSLFTLQNLLQFMYTLPDMNS